VRDSPACGHGHDPGHGHGHGHAPGIGLAIVLTMLGLAPLQAEPPHLLFNGKNLAGFETGLRSTKHADPARVFTVVDGTIRISGLPKRGPHSPPMRGRRDFLSRAHPAKIGLQVAMVPRPRSTRHPLMG
jgi:hypothetical protein